MSNQWQNRKEQKVKGQLVSEYLDCVIKLNDKTLIVNDGTRLFQS